MSEAPSGASLVLPSATTTTTVFKSASTVRTQRHGAHSFLHHHKGINANSSSSSTDDDPNEARYWTQKMGLGSASDYGTLNKKYASPRSLNLAPVRPAVVSQVIFGPHSPTSPLAVACGPRVALYGTNKSCLLYTSPSPRD